MSRTHRGEIKAFPQSVEAERALLGGLIKSPKHLGEVAEILTAEDFHRPEHARLLAAMLDMQEREIPIDLVTLAEEIGREQDAYGGLTYVLDLPDRCPSTTNLKHYAGIVRNDSIRRRGIGAIEGLRERFETRGEDPVELVEGVISELMRPEFTRKARGEWADAAEIAFDERMRLHHAYLHPEEARKTARGLSTGFLGLDKALGGGLHPGDLCVLAGRPAMGKSAFAMSIAARVSRRADPETKKATLDSARTVAVFSLEMTRAQLVQRMIAERGKVRAGMFRVGIPNGTDLQGIDAGVQWLEHCKIRIDDTPGLTLAQIRSRAQRLQAQTPEGIALVIVDYLQIMGVADPKAPREQAVSANSGGLKNLAKELECPVIALSQLNRGLELRKDKRPIMSDLRESGAIEQDADSILFLYRDEYYYPETTECPGEAECIVGKNRHGSGPTVRFNFEAWCTRFEELPPDLHAYSGGRS